MPSKPTLVEKRPSNTFSVADATPDRLTTLALKLVYICRRENAVPSMGHEAAPLPFPAARIVLDPPLEVLFVYELPLAQLVVLCRTISPAERIHPDALPITFKRPENAGPTTLPVGGRWRPVAALNIPYTDAAAKRFAERVGLRLYALKDHIEPNPEDDVSDLI